MLKKIFIVLFFLFFPFGLSARDTGYSYVDSYTSKLYIKVLREFDVFLKNNFSNLYAESEDILKLKDKCDFEKARDIIYQRTQAAGKKSKEKIFYLILEGQLIMQCPRNPYLAFVLVEEAAGKAESAGINTKRLNVIANELKLFSGLNKAETPSEISACFSTYMDSIKRKQEVLGILDSLGREKQSKKKEDKENYRTCCSSGWSRSYSDREVGWFSHGILYITSALLLIMLMIVLKVFFTLFGRTSAVCPVARFNEIEKIKISTQDNKKVVLCKDDQYLDKFISYFGDGGQDTISDGYVYTAVFRLGIRKYTIEFSRCGWNFLGEPRAIRALDNSAGLILMIEKLLG